MKIEKVMRALLTRQDIPATICGAHTGFGGEPARPHAYPT